MLHAVEISSNQQRKTAGHMSVIDRLVNSGGLEYKMTREAGAKGEK